MYLIYDNDQTTFGRRKLISWRDIGSFRPTWLVRVSDMKRVHGSVATLGYCALSYSWNYSGDIVEHENGKSTCDDKGLHKIIKHSWDSDHQGRRVETVTMVKFDTVIQEICRNFGIDYIWYDKVCIDQDDEKSKQEEINQMHNIYKNALFTVVLIPELDPPQSSPSSRNIRFQHDPYDGFCFQQILRSEWCKRMWTLEEAVLSRNMVFVGQAAHFWSHQMTELFFYGRRYDHQRLHPLVEELCTARKEACKVLYFAHRRMSTKEHDKVFALTNIFADTIQIKSNYSLNIRTVLQEFYSNLAKEDLTILYFGQPLVNYPSTMRKYTFLPSWTVFYR
ncbi:heterokaryon incompatibility protein-domain-containing protein [Fennellomyces sp. T-0311]|nr:heterokaryon incompatibility protein-domain-containing protein [Fennellomyces sp. T-0311]